MPLRRRRPFVLLWAGQSVSELGSQITTVALPLTAIEMLHVGAGELGFLQTALWIPWLLFALLIGSYVDTHRRRPLLIAADLGRLAALLGIAAMALVGALTLPVLAGLAFALGTLTVLFEVTYQSYVPTVVPSSQLLDANSRLQVSASIAAVGGPGLGGVLVHAVTAPFALIADAVSYLVSVVSLLAIGMPEPVPDSGAQREGVLIRIWEGLVVTYRHRELRALVGVAATYNFFSEWILTIFLLYAIQEQNLGAVGLGLVLMGGAVGTVAGSALTSAAIRTLGLGRALLGSVTLECVAFAFLPAIGGTRAVATTLFAVLFGLNGIGVALSSVAAVSVRQTVTPLELLGRMTASYRTFSYGAVALGAALGGLIGQFTGLRLGILIGGIGLLSTIAWVVLSPLRRMQTLPDAPRPEDRS